MKRVYEAFRRLSLFSVLLALGVAVLLSGLAYFCYYLEQAQRELVVVSQWQF